MKTSTFLLTLALIISALIFIKSKQSSLIELNSNQSITLIDKDMAPWLDMGQTNSLTGLLWIQTIIYFGESVISNSKMSHLINLLEAVTTLDSKFYLAYQWAGLFNQIPKSDSYEILEKGIKELPDDWRLHSIYAHKLIKLDSNYLKASRVMETQKNNSSAPDYIRNIHKTYAQFSDETNSTVMILLESYTRHSGIIANEYKNQIKDIVLEYKSPSTVEKAFDKIDIGNRVQFTKGLKMLLK